MSGDDPDTQSTDGETDTYRGVVKPFGDGGAHITVPSSLIGETVEVTNLDWDDELDSEIMRENGKEFATCIKTPVGTELYAPPAVRERFIEQSDMLHLGILRRTGDMIQPPDGKPRDESRDGVGEELTLPMSALESHVTILGDSGMGKPAFMTNLAYQYAFTDTSDGFCVIGDENGGIGDFTSLLESCNIDFNYIDTTEMRNVTELRDAVADTSIHVPLVTHVPMTMPTGGGGFTSAIIDERAASVEEHSVDSYPMFIDTVHPDECAVSELSEWHECGISLVMGVQFIDQFSNSAVTWLISNTEVMSFSVTPEIAGCIASELSVSKSDLFVGRACGLGRAEVMLCKRDNEVVQTYPKVPPVSATTK